MLSACLPSRIPSTESRLIDKLCTARDLALAPQDFAACDRFARACAWQSAQNSFRGGKNHFARVLCLLACRMLTNDQVSGKGAPLRGAGWQPGDEIETQIAIRFGFGFVTML